MATPKDRDGLTPRQRAFVLEYLKDYSVSGAARRAGYKSPPNLKQLPDLKRALEEAKKNHEKRLARTAKDVFGDIVLLTKEAWVKGDLKTALRGLELQGKHLGMFVEKVEHSGCVRVVLFGEDDAV